MSRRLLSGAEAQESPEPHAEGVGQRVLLSLTVLRRERMRGGCMHVDDAGQLDEADCAFVVDRIWARR